MTNDQATEQKFLDYLKRVTADLRETTRRLRERRGEGAEPIAIVGMACRYPGGVTLAGGPVASWSPTAATRIGPFPADRGWDLDGLYDPDPDTPGTSYTREGGFLYDAGEFDPAVLRHLARARRSPWTRSSGCCWRSRGRRSSAPASTRTSLRGSRTGVFAGRHVPRLRRWAWHRPPTASRAPRHRHAGSVVSGRVSYTFGLEGPAVTVDTACSSSLVALHLAVQALRRGRVRRWRWPAASTVMATPDAFVEFSRQRGLAAGRALQGVRRRRRRHRLGRGRRACCCWSGCPTRGATATRCSPWCAARAVNQDGASNGLTAPNGPSQQRVIRQALADARLSTARRRRGRGARHRHHARRPDRGAGAARDLRPGPPDDRPLWLGSIKSNIGHTQAAAGVAGVIKMVHGDAARRAAAGPCTSTSRRRTSTGRRARCAC